MNRAFFLTRLTKKTLLVGLLIALLGCAGLVTGLYVSNSKASNLETATQAKIIHDPAIRATIEAQMTPGPPLVAP